MKTLTVEEQIYFCKYHDIDTSLYTTIGIKEQDVQRLIKKFKELRNI